MTLKEYSILLTEEYDTAQAGAETVLVRALTWAYNKFPKLRKLAKYPGFSVFENNWAEYDFYKFLDETDTSPIEWKIYAESGMSDKLGWVLRKKDNLIRIGKETL